MVKCAFTDTRRSCAKNARKGSANGRSEGRAMRNENCRARLVREYLREVPRSAAHAITRGAPPGSKTEAVERADSCGARKGIGLSLLGAGRRPGNAARAVQAAREQLCTEAGGDVHAPARLGSPSGAKNRAHLGPRAPRSAARGTEAAEPSRRANRRLCRRISTVHAR